MNAGSGRGTPRPLLKKIGWVTMVPPLGVKDKKITALGHLSKWIFPWIRSVPGASALDAPGRLPESSTPVNKA